MENARRDEGALVTSANQPLLTIVAGGEAYTIGEDAGPITIGRELPAQVRVPDPGSPARTCAFSSTTGSGQRPTVAAMVSFSTAIESP